MRMTTSSICKVPRPLRFRDEEFQRKEQALFFKSRMHGGSGSERSWLWLASDGSECAREEAEVLNLRVQVLATLAGDDERFC